MKYLITGATGFIGPHLIRTLTSAGAGHTCRCLVRKPDKASQILNDCKIEIIQGDITKKESVYGIADNIDCVLHLATLGHMSNFIVTEEMFDAVNVHGAVNVMKEAARAKVKRAVYCSSVAAMGICDEVPATEKTQCNPHHPYGRSKLKAEKQIKRLFSETGLSGVIIRFSMVYGPGDWRDMLKLTRMKKKGLFPKIGSRPKLTPLIHVNDAVQGLLLAAEKGRAGEVYLITNAKSEPFDKIGKIIQDALGSSIPSIYVPELMALSLANMIEKTFTFWGKSPPVSRKNIESTLADRVFSIEKAQAELSFNPKIDPQTGIRDTVKWYMENGWV